MRTSTLTTSGGPRTRPAADSPLGAPPSEAQLLLHRVDAWLLARVVRQGDHHATIRCAAPDVCIARLELESGALTVFVETELVSPIAAVESLLRVTREGLRLHVRDAASRAAGERLIRWRIELERFAPQWRNQSP